jgi:hypothetical protein
MRPAEQPLNSEDVWCEVFSTATTDRPALFLDREGAIVEKTGFLCHVTALAAEGARLDADYACALQSLAARMSV